jgi:hypothetical protein
MWFDDSSTRCSLDSVAARASVKLERSVDEHLRATDTSRLLQLLVERLARIDGDANESIRVLGALVEVLRERVDALSAQLDENRLSGDNARLSGAVQSVLRQEFDLLFDRQ